MIEQYVCLPFNRYHPLPDISQNLVACHVQFRFVLQATRPLQLKYRHYITKESATMWHIERAYKITFCMFSRLFLLRTALKFRIIS